MSEPDRWIKTGPRVAAASHDVGFQAGSSRSAKRHRRVQAQEERTVMSEDVPMFRQVKESSRLPQKNELEILCSLIPAGARVLDLGCGDGEVLAYLKQRLALDAHGVEIDRDNVFGAVGRGISVYHGDMLEGMSVFPDGFFDIILCSRTLQEVPQPAAAIREMLRVGQRVLVGFHNYGYWRNRLCFLVRGVQPQCDRSGHRWYNSPDIHPMTIRAFEEFCEAERITLMERRFLRRGGGGRVHWRANLLADYAMFLIGRQAG